MTIIHICTYHAVVESTLPSDQDFLINGAVYEHRKVEYI